VASPTPTQQNFILYQGATATLRSEDFDKAYIETADVFVHGSVTLANPSGAALAQAARWARQAGKEVIFDVNLRPGVWPDLDTALQRILVALTSASVVKVNEVETEFLTGTRDPARGARRLIEQGLQLCCVSLGDDGAYFATSAASGHVPAFKVEAVDTTGCGDAFVAGLAFELSSRGKPPKQLSETELRNMIRFANACGALTATQLGAMSALPDRAAVEALLQSTNAAK
ncbi:MAG: carbohydrate kinase, partial [Chloroflexi bacterium]|nr:carbohydrate kinase [Chloroflexota bacterium]